MSEPTVPLLSDLADRMDERVGHEGSPPPGSAGGPVLLLDAPGAESNASRSRLGTPHAGDIAFKFNNVALG